MNDENKEDINLENVEEKDMDPETTEEIDTPNDKVEEEDIDVDKIEIETRNIPEEKIEYDESIDPDEAKNISAVVEKQTASLKKALQDQQDRLEVETYIKQNPEFAKYEGAILKHLKDPVYSRIPVKNIAKIVAGDNLIKLGAKLEREAQAKAAATKSTGTMVRKPEGSGTDWTKAPKGDFEDHKRRVLGQR